MKTKELYAPEDQELFERALVRPMKWDQEYHKMMKGITELLDTFKEKSLQELAKMMGIKF